MNEREEIRERFDDNLSRVRNLLNLYDHLDSTSGPSRSKERFSLVDLAAFRGRTVDELIAQSVEEHLERSSFNHPGEIDEVLAKIEFGYRIEKPLTDALASLMIRRHAIAHRFDREVDGLVGPGPNLRVRSIGGKPIDPNSVAKWIKAVQEFGEDILSEI